MSESVDDSSKPQQAQQLIEDEAQYRNEVQRQYDHPADEHGPRGMGERTGMALAETAPAQPREHHGFTEQSGAEKANHDKRHGSNSNDRDTQQHQQDRYEQHGQQCGQRRYAGLGLEGLRAPDNALPEQQREAGI